MNDPSAGFRALIEENVKASVHRIAENSVITNVRTLVAPNYSNFTDLSTSTMLY